MLRDRFNQILEDAIIKYINEVDPEILNSIHSYLIENQVDDKVYLYNLQVAQVEDFPVWVCAGGGKIPKNGCRMIQCQNSFDGDRPYSCDFCGNGEFEKIESLEEWRSRYESN